MYSHCILTALSLYRGLICGGLGGQHPARTRLPDLRERGRLHRYKGSTVLDCPVSCCLTTVYNVNWMYNSCTSFNTLSPVPYLLDSVPDLTVCDLKGAFEHGRKCGQGEQTFKATGNKYIGEFLYGKPHGKGISCCIVCILIVFIRAVRYVNRENVRCGRGGAVQRRLRARRGDRAVSGAYWAVEYSALSYCTTAFCTYTMLSPLRRKFTRPECTRGAS